MDKEVVIIGASGHGKVIADMVRQSGDCVLGFLDDNPEVSGSFVGVPILGSIDRFQEYEKSYFVVAVGNAVIRERIADKMQDVKWYIAIHPAAVVSDIDVSIGEGSVVMANAVVNAGTTIGKHCIINSGAVVEHDNDIEDFAHISVGAKLAGSVHIGKRSWIGIGASVSNNIFICGDCMVGAGAVVVKNIEIAGTYVGVPVRKIVKGRKTSMSARLKSRGGGSGKPINGNIHLIINAFTSYEIGRSA